MKRRRKGAIPGQVRQGDVLIERVGSIPEGAVPVPRDGGRVVLAYGEQTGHAHAIIEDGVEQLADPIRREISYLAIKRDGISVRHEEHGKIPLGGGTSRVTRQREYLGEERRVRD